MAFSLNKVMLIGKLGLDAETRFTTTNVSVTTLSIATDRSYKGKDGNWVNEVTWHRVVAFNLSDFLKENLKKARKIYVEGRITKRDYVDKEGVKRYVTEITSERIILLDYSGAPQDAEEQTQSTDVNIEDNDDLPF